MTLSSEAYEDPEAEARWCERQRDVVVQHFSNEGVRHGRVGEWPAWHVAPYVAVWAIESLAVPGAIGWWAFSGDLPTDYISSADVGPPQHPRKAVSVIAKRWLEMADAWKAGREHEDATIPGPHTPEELVLLLSSRAQLLLKWVEDDGFWPE